MWNRSCVDAFKVWVWSMLLASLGVFLNMPLSRVICVTHYTGFPFGSASFTELLCWYGTVLSALPLFTCRNSVALCRPWLGVKRFVPLLVANFYVVPGLNPSTMQRRAFSIVAPSIWNSLPSQIRLLPKSYTPLLYKMFKTDLFHRGWTGSASG